LTLRYLEIFSVVCQTLNMTTAAQLLFISQSAVSQAISALEKYYQVVLFERLSHKLYLTSAGQKLWAYAQRLLALNAEINREMQVLGENGTLRLGASVTVGTNVLPALIGQFKQLQPRADIYVHEDNTAAIESRLLADQTDLGLVEGQIIAPDIRTTVFATDELTLICSPRHRFARMAKVPAAELENEDFLVREAGSGTRQTFEDALSAQQITWHTKWVCSNTDTIKAAVAANLGVAVISRIAVRQEVASG